MKGCCPATFILLQSLVAVLTTIVPERTGVLPKNDELTVKFEVRLTLEEGTLVCHLFFKPHCRLGIPAKQRYRISSGLGSTGHIWGVAGCLSFLRQRIYLAKMTDHNAPCSGCGLSSRKMWSFLSPYSLDGMGEGMSDCSCVSISATHKQAIHMTV